ncbi:MAG: sulfopropanediol 3-dehydrogenase, partial [Candidatus Azotimanducaceae bacterium]
MTIEFLKKADKSATTGEDDTRKIVSQMLSDIESGGEQKAIEYATKLDNYSGNIVVTSEEIEAATAKLSQQVKDDIQFAYERVRGFAEKQRAALIDFEVELSPGLFAGQKQIPVQTAGCYV